MADAEHVEIVQQGAEAIRTWLEEHFPLGMDLYAAYLFQSDLEGALLGGAMLSRANLDEANLAGADLSGADLSRARLCGTSLLGTELRMADLRDSRLTGADLTLADLSDANLTGADFTDARFAYTLLGNVDLSGARGLAKARHAGPSSIGIDTLLKSDGRIPDAFLNGCGVPAALCANLRALSEGSPRLNSCYLAFDQADRDFALRLSADIQAKGVRCWLWGTATPGESKLLRQVERRLRQYDRLVVAFSQSAIVNEPIVREVEQALRRETVTGIRVLFPLRLDDSLENWIDPLQRQISNKKVIDFRDWQRDPGLYRVSVQDLARQLVARPGS